MKKRSFIAKDLFVATVMSCPNEFKLYAHAYCSYDDRLTKVKRMLTKEQIDEIVAEGKNEFDYDKDLLRMINWAAKELFHLNDICKKTRNYGFLSHVQGPEEKEEAISEANNIICSLAFGSSTKTV
jgi:hypothetical protein